MSSVLHTHTCMGHTCTSHTETQYVKTERERKDKHLLVRALIFCSGVGMKRETLPCPTPSPGNFAGLAGKHSLPASDYKMPYVTWGMFQILFLGKEVILESMRGRPSSAWNWKMPKGALSSLEGPGGQTLESLASLPWASALMF